MARLPFTLQTLPGSRRSRSIELSLGLSDPEGVKAWEASTRGAGGGKSINYYGQERGQISRFNRRMVLKGVNIAQDNWHHIESWRDQGEPLTLSPPWSGATGGTVNTVLPLGKPAPGEDHLQDFLISEKRSAVDFERYCNRYHPDTGLEAKYHVPLYTDGWQGEQVNIGDVVNDEHFPSFEYRAYTDRDAADVGSITRFYLDPRWDADLFWVGQLVMVQTRELDTNVYEVARVDAVNSAGNYLDLSQTTVADAVLTNTSDYTYANRTSISSTMVADADMSDSGVGSWADENTPELKEKTATQNETGTQALRVIGGAQFDGIAFSPGDVPADTNLVFLIRFNLIRGSVVTQFLNDAGQISQETFSTLGWQWGRYCLDVGGAGQETFTVKMYQAAATETEWTVGRVYIFENAVDNGGMEGVYVDESGGGGGTIDVAPGWGERNCELNVPAPGPDLLDEDADEHGGDKAQRVYVDAAAEGVLTDAAVFVADKWFLVGAYLKITTGLVTIQEKDVANILTGATGASYTFHAAAYQATGAGRLVVQSEGAADFLIDDVMCVRLPGNPYDDCYYDLPEALPTDAVTVFGCWTPDFDHDSFPDGEDPYIVFFSRNTADATNQFRVWYYSPGSLFAATTIFGGAAAVTADEAETFNAGDNIYWAARITGAAGSQVITVWAKVGTDATVTDSSAASGTTPAGLTRMWLGDGSDFNERPFGVVSGITVINEAMSDAEIEEVLEIMAGDTGYEQNLTLLNETYGVIYEIEPNGITPWHPADGEYIKCDIALREVGRIGAFRDAY